MRIYHGSDDEDVDLKQVKSGFGYHPGAGPVEFLGPSFSDNPDVARSYGKNVVEKQFSPKKIKRYRSLNGLKNDIIQTFGLPQKGQSLSEYYRDIAESYRIKLQAEGYDAVIFPEGIKTDTRSKKANTIIPITQDFFEHSKVKGAF